MATWAHPVTEVRGRKVIAAAGCCAGVLGVVPLGTYVRPIASGTASAPGVEAGVFGLLGRFNLLDQATETCAKPAVVGTSTSLSGGGIKTL